jgi:ribosomal protein L9
LLSVKPGHARNHLVPAKLAAYATPERLAEAEAKRAEWVEDADAAGADDAVDRVRSEKTSDASERATLPPAPEPRVAPGPDKRGDE